VTVTLTLGEILLGANVGVMRRISAMRTARLETYGAASNYWQTDIEACLAEIAVAKALNRYWLNPILPGQVRGTSDLTGINVRSTPRPDGCLLLHQADPDDLPFVLVRGTAPTLDLPGWCYGREGKNEGFWRDDDRVRPAFFVPAAALHPIETLLL
jgi:hypothetical protein